MNALPTYNRKYYNVSAWTLYGVHKRAITKNSPIYWSSQAEYDLAHQSITIHLGDLALFLYQDECMFCIIIDNKFAGISTNSVFKPTLVASA